jgi:hypothetical protein
MSRAWAIFRETYNYPRIPFRSIGRQCFAWALRKAWAELRSAQHSDAAISTRLIAIQTELDGLRYRSFGTNIGRLEAELKSEAKPLIAEQFRRSVAVPVLKLAA